MFPPLLLSEDMKFPNLDTTAYTGASYVRPVHVLVATPGRLCELITDESIPMFRDMSGIRFLIVDEADRIVEEGHFPEVGKNIPSVVFQKRFFVF